MTTEITKEFFELKQKDMTVVEYASKFDDLSRYAPFLVSTPEARVEGFIDGLDHHISDCIMAYEGKPMERVLDLSLNWENKRIELKALRKIQVSKKKEKRLELTLLS